MTRDYIFIALAIICYFVGVAFITPNDVDTLKKKGISEQEEYTYIDNDGEEHEDKTLISIDGLGKVLTYRDVYFSALAMLVISMIAGRLSMGDKEEFKHMVFGNCIIGVLLIYLTTKSNIIATILFWAGVVFARMTYSNNIKKNI